MIEIKFNPQPENYFMYLGLVYYPEIEDPRFHALRNTYDPYSKVMREHLGFVFPTPETIDRENLEKHIYSVLNRQRPFKINITGLFKTWDHWLMLGIKEGHDPVVRLHNELYSGLLKPYHRKDLPFEPHVALGYFGSEDFDVFAEVKDPPINKQKYEAVLHKAETMQFSFKRTLDCLTLVRFDKSFTRCENLRDFLLFNNG